MSVLRKRRGELLVGWLVAVFCVCGCTRDPGELPPEQEVSESVWASSLTASSRDNRAADQPLSVVATYSILGDWVQRIGGERVRLTVLVGPEGDAHTYEPTPRDSVALAEADIVFENGLGFEVWLDRLFQASGSTAKRVVVTESIKPRELVVAGSRIEIDPHVWHLPVNARLMVEAITSALEEKSPESSAGFRLRQKAYVAQLDELDRWISQEALSIPDSRRKLVTTHDTFGYLADAYDFEVISVLGSVSSESSDPSAGEMAKVIARIRNLKIPAIFAENILNPKLTRRIAAEAGVKLVPTLYTDALGQADSPGSDYLQMMRFNVRTIAEALR